MGTQMNVLGGIFVLVIILMLGFSLMRAPQYQAGDPRTLGYSQQLPGESGTDLEGPIRKDKEEPIRKDKEGND